MKNNFPNSLHEFQHSKPKIPQHAPHQVERSNDRTRTKWAKEEVSLSIPPYQTPKFAPIVVENNVLNGWAV